MVKFCRISNSTKASEMDTFAVLFVRLLHVSEPVAVVERNKTSVLEGGKGVVRMSIFGVLHICFLLKGGKNFCNRTPHVLASGSTCLSWQARQSVYHCVFVSCCDLLCTLSRS